MVQLSYEIMLIKPIMRSSDLLTEDHPTYTPDAARGFSRPLRLNPLLRGLTFIGVLCAVELVGVAVIAVVSMMLTGDIRILSSNDIHSPFVLCEMILEVVAVIGGYLVVVYAMEQRSHPLELRFSRWRGLVAGGLIGLAAISVCIGILAITGNYRIVGFNADYDPWIDILAMGLCAGIAEEIMMRDMLFRLFEEWLGSWGSVAISALVFGLLHITNQNGTVWGGLAIAIEDGILAAALYCITRSLWVCIGEHIMWNIAEGPIFGSIVSGNGEQKSWLVAKWSGSDIMTGGSFGLEASIVPVVLMGIAGVALMVYAQQKKMLVKPSWTRKRLLAQS